LNACAAATSAPTETAAYATRPAVAQRAKPAHSHAARARVPPATAVHPSGGSQKSAATKQAASTAAVTTRSRSIAPDLRQSAACVGEIDNGWFFGCAGRSELLAGATETAVGVPV
jgi:hypothetical protein